MGGGLLFGGARCRFAGELERWRRVRLAGLGAECDMCHEGKGCKRGGVFRTCP